MAWYLILCKWKKPCVWLQTMFLYNMLPLQLAIVNPCSNGKLGRVEKTNAILSLIRPVWCFLPLISVSNFQFFRCRVTSNSVLYVTHQLYSYNSWNWVSYETVMVSLLLAIIVMCSSASNYLFCTFELIVEVRIWRKFLSRRRKVL